MFFNLRKYISPVVKEKILNSMVYRVYSRIVLIKPEIRFSVELTTKCNARCRMCTRQKLVNNKCLEVGEMRKEVLDKVFTEMKKFKKSGYKVVFTPMGLGEPLMYSQIYKIIKKVRKMGIKVIVVTNGLLLNDTNIGLLLKSGVNEITVSLNADNKSRYKKLMGIDGYVIVKGNVKRLFIKRNRYSFNTDINIQYLGRVDDYNKENGYWKQYMKGRDKWFVHEFVNQETK